MREIYLLTSGFPLYAEAIENMKENVKVTIIPKQKNRVFRAIRRLFYSFNLPFKFFLIKKNKFRDNSIFIITDGSPWKKNINYLRKKFPNSNFIFWFWNSIKEDEIIEYIKKNSDRVYTFDKKDSLKYEISYLPQFYWNKKQEKQEKQEKQKVLFVGNSNGRIKEIESIWKELEKEKITNYFYLVGNNQKSENLEIKINKRPISYEEITNRILETEAILEINKKGQDGLTLRALEALFYNKKLITNNQVIKEYDFYREENILVINPIEDKEIGKKIANFLMKKNVIIDNEIKEKYTVDSWIKNLISTTKL